MVGRGGVGDIDAWVDNDVQSVPVPWWGWHKLADDWKTEDGPSSRPTVNSRSRLTGTRSIARGRPEGSRWVQTTPGGLFSA